MNEFCKWLFTNSHRNFTVLAHGSKIYDSIFILKYMKDNGVIPTVTRAGTKIMFMEEPKLRIRFLDSLNFLAMRLAKLPKTFGFDNIKKGFFCHRFNSIYNQDYRGSFPGAEWYDPEYMIDSVREEFETWHRGMKDNNVEFDLQKELYEYCNDDVNILRRALIEFRKLVIELTGTRVFDPDIEDYKYVDYVDPFKCVTTPGLAYKIYRTLFLREHYTATLTDSCDTVLGDNIKITKKGGQYFRNDKPIDHKVTNLHFY